MVIEPKVSIGLGGSSTEPTYDSTGGQPPFEGDQSNTDAQFCGGAAIYPGFGVGLVSIGLDVNVCSGSNVFGNNDQTLFQIPRHGPNGDVTLESSTSVIIDLLFKGEVAFGPSQSWFVTGGVGPSFRDLDLTLTSDQSFFGGGVPSESESSLQVGLGLSAGVAALVCSDCIGGNPLKVGVEGRARFFPEESISLTSPAFGFTETGTTGRWGDYSTVMMFGVPLTMSDVRLKRGIVRVAHLDNGIDLYRYRYEWSDQLYVGVMAQEVAEIVPDAVVRGDDGYLRVNYARLGLRLQTWSEWTALH